MNRPSLPRAAALLTLLCAACTGGATNESAPVTDHADDSGHSEQAPAMTDLRSLEIHTLSGDATTLADQPGDVLLLVNVASQCGLTPQYEGLQRLQQTYGDRGLTVVGFPCNQFAGQEPGTADEIRAFCDANYGVSFPLMEKVDVNGAGRHPIYAALTAVPDATGEAGDVQWNFEKFLVAPDGTITRFRPRTEPEDATLVAAIEAALD